jgi:membrane-bound inhibitor of C-type lysozyme
MSARRAGVMLAASLFTERCMSQRILVASIVAIGVLAGCQNGPTKEELEAAKNTVDCERPGERIVIKFEDGEARLLMPDATRVVLYQVPSASGFRYINGLMELRGKGRMELELTREQQAVHLTCKAYEIPKKP